MTPGHASWPGTTGWGPAYYTQESIKKNFHLLFSAFELVGMQSFLRLCSVKFSSLVPLFTLSLFVRDITIPLPRKARKL
jgi:hypothetical protein